VRNVHSALPQCPANATGEVGKSVSPAGVWYRTDNGHCVFVGIDVADTKPANATPVVVEGYPGRYGTLEHGVRTSYAPAPDAGHPTGNWLVLTMAAGASQEVVGHLIVVPSSSHPIDTTLP